MGQNLGAVLARRRARDLAHAGAVDDARASRWPRAALVYIAAAGPRRKAEVAAFVCEDLSAQ
eukprot:9480254-Pyramimonas_sp.AAC.1